eukprot:gene5934-8182_t
MSLIVSYKDADIYDRDATCFAPGCWLNDSCINYSFKLIEDKYQELMNITLLMDPAVVSFMRIQSCDDEEDEELANGLNIFKKKWIIVPVSDNQSFETFSSHWSLLLVHRLSGFSFHYDSNGSYNQLASELTAERINLICKSPKNKVIQLNCPQQSNGFDCGIYTILFAEFCCEMIRKFELCNILVSENLFDDLSIMQALHMKITQDSASTFRNNMHSMLYKIKT